MCFESMFAWFALVNLYVCVPLLRSLGVDDLFFGGECYRKVVYSDNSYEKKRYVLSIVSNIKMVHGAMRVITSTYHHGFF